MIFREALIADISQIQIVRNAVKENTLSDPALVTDKDVEDYITNRGKGWVCEIENLIVGFAIADLQDSNLWALFIHPDFEKKGIGKKLHEEMLNWYFSQGKENVWLSTSPNSRAEIFYRHAGWKETGVYGKGEIKFEMSSSDWEKINKQDDEHKILQLNFAPFPELETERLLLRKMLPEDAPEIFLLRSDEKVMLYIGKEPVKTMKEVEEFISRIDDGIKSNNAIMWGIALKNNPEKLIGNICYWRIQKENFRAEIGYMLQTDFWRKGIMKESIQKVVDYGFNAMKLHSIEARIHAENTASAAILETTGFQKEGHLKDEFCFRGKFLDTIIYSRLQ